MMVIGGMVEYNKNLLKKINIYYIRWRTKKQKKITCLHVETKMDREKEWEITNIERSAYRFVYVSARVAKYQLDGDE